MNAVIGSHKKKGGCLPLQASCDEFKAWLDSCNLTHMVTRGSEFTWTNGRKGNTYSEKRLDRSICNDAWLSSWTSSSCSTLTRSQSDHHLLLLILKRGVKSHPYPFKFHQMWLEHPDYKNLVEQVWKKDFYGCPMFVL